MIKKILFWIALIVLDIFLYLLIGFILLNYEDNWNSTKGPYWSLGGMTWLERIAYVSYYILIAINAIVIILLIYRVIKKHLIKN